MQRKKITVITVAMLGIQGVATDAALVSIGPHIDHNNRIESTINGSTMNHALNSTWDPYPQVQVETGFVDRTGSNGGRVVGDASTRVELRSDEILLTADASVQASGPVTTGRARIDHTYNVSLAAGISRSTEWRLDYVLQNANVTIRPGGGTASHLIQAGDDVLEGSVFGDFIDFSLVRLGVGMLPTATSGFSGLPLLDQTDGIFEVRFIAGGGLTPEDPILPTPGAEPASPPPLEVPFGELVIVDFAPAAPFVFVDAQSGRYFDPVASDGFLYVMNDSSLFEEILEFPLGFNGQFTVWAEGSALGSFVGGESFSFLSSLGHGVHTFAITGIDPLVDATDPLAFPLRLTFDSPTADFTQFAMITSTTSTEHSTPEPASAILTWLGLHALLVRRKYSHPA